MKYSFLTNLALTYYGECPYGTDAYQDANCSDTSSDGTTSTSQSPTSTFPGSDSGISNSDQNSQIGSGTGQNNTGTTTTVGESPMLFGLTPTGAFSIFAGILLLIIGLGVLLALLNRRSRKNKEKLSD